MLMVKPFPIAFEQFFDTLSGMRRACTFSLGRGGYRCTQAVSDMHASVLLKCGRSPVVGTRNNNVFLFYGGNCWGQTGADTGTNH